MKFHPYKTIIASISILSLFLSQTAQTLATIETENSQDKIYYAHTDHLTGSNAITDKNGNLTKANNWQYTYDYNNRLIKANQGAINLNYGYDHQGERLFYSTASSTTIYANKYLNYQTGPKKITKQIYSGDLLLATIETENSQDKIYYAHTDHLTGSNAITDKNGNLAQTLDYYPFGEVRLDERTGTFNQQKKFTGKELDQETGLYYFGARYQDGKIGRFISIDPAYLAVGDGKFEQRYNRSLKQHLSNPL